MPRAVRVFFRHDYVSRGHECKAAARAKFLDCNTLPGTTGEPARVPCTTRLVAIRRRARPAMLIASRNASNVES